MTFRRARCPAVMLPDAVGRILGREPDDAPP
jgi:hypothetical protein